MSKINKKMKSNPIIKIMIFLVICAIVGAIIGILMATVFDDFMVRHIKDENALIELLRVYGLILVFMVGFWVHIIIHEAGHLVFGLVSGYSFVSFRVGSLTLIRENGKLKRKKFNIPGTAGQCLMMPPELKDGKFPYVLYNFGGVIMNIIVSIIALFISPKSEFPMNAILFLFGLSGLVAALTNGIPLKISGIANDAYNILSMSKDEEAQNGFYIQLKVNGLQSQGMRIKDMPLEYFKLKENSDLTNPLNTAIRLMEYNWYLDHLNFEEAKKSLYSLMPSFNRIVPLFRNEINCERIFLELIGDCNKSFIDNLYDKGLKKYFKMAKFMIGKKRILMAYEAFYNEDKDQTLRHYEELISLSTQYPIKGEADMELLLANWVKEKIIV